MMETIKQNKKEEASNIPKVESMNAFFEYLVEMMDSAPLSVRSAVIKLNNGSASSEYLNDAHLSAVQSGSWTVSKGVINELRNDYSVILNPDFVDDEMRERNIEKYKKLKNNFKNELQQIRDLNPSNEDDIRVVNESAFAVKTIMNLLEMVISKLEQRSS